MRLGELATLWRHVLDVPSLTSDQLTERLSAIWAAVDKFTRKVNGDKGGTCACVA
jgi:hypothetical protein